MAKLSGMNESIRILMDLVWQIQSAINGITKESARVKDTELVRTVCFHVLMQVWKFKQEWKHIQRTLAKDNEYLQKVLYIVSQAMERIMRCEDALDDFRNKFLAHARSREGGDYVPAFELLRHPKMPTAYAEMLGLGKLAEIAAQWLFNFYPNETKESWEWMDINRVEPRSKGARKLEQVKTDVVQVWGEICERAEQSGLPLRSREIWESSGMKLTG